VRGDTRLEVDVSRFARDCGRLLDEVAATSQPLVVTRDGAPLVEIAPVTPAPSLHGSVTFLVGDDELITPLGEPWA
jgi:hypothetical protein